MSELRFTIGRGGSADKSSWASWWRARRYRCMQGWDCVVIVGLRIGRFYFSSTRATYPKQRSGSEPHV